MREIEAVERGTHLHRNSAAVIAARPKRIARLPGRDETMALLLPAEVHEVRLALTRDRQLDLALAKPDHARTLAHHRLPGPLARNPALTLAQHMVDGGGDRRHDAQRLALGHERTEAFGVFLGNERCRKLARLPALVLHHPRQERNIVA